MTCYIATILSMINIWSIRRDANSPIFSLMLRKELIIRTTLMMKVMYLSVLQIKLNFYRNIVNYETDKPRS